MEIEIDQAQQEIWDSFDELEEEIRNGTYKPRLEYRFPDPRWQLPAPVKVEDNKK